MGGRVRHRPVRGHAGNLAGMEDDTITAAGIRKALMAARFAPAARTAGPSIRTLKASKWFLIGAEDAKAACQLLSTAFPGHQVQAAVHNQRLTYISISRKAGS